MGLFGGCELWEWDGGLVVHSVGYWYVIEVNSGYLCWTGSAETSAFVSLMITTFNYWRTPHVQTEEFYMPSLHQSGARLCPEIFDSLPSLASGDSVVCWFHILQEITHQKHSMKTKTTPWPKQQPKKGFTVEKEITATRRLLSNFRFFQTPFVNKTVSNPQLSIS